MEKVATRHFWCRPKLCSKETLELHLARTQQTVWPNQPGFNTFTVQHLVRCSLSHTHMNKHISIYISWANAIVPHHKAWQNKQRISTFWTPLVAFIQTVHLQFICMWSQWTRKHSSPYAQYTPPSVQRMELTQAANQEKTPLKIWWMLNFLQTFLAQLLNCVGK